MSRLTFRRWPRYPVSSRFRYIQPFLNGLLPPTAPLPPSPPIHHRFEGTVTVDVFFFSWQPVFDEELVLIRHVEIQSCSVLGIRRVPLINHLKSSTSVEIGLLNTLDAVSFFQQNISKSLFIVLDNMKYTCSEIRKFMTTVLLTILFIINFCLPFS